MYATCAREVRFHEVKNPSTGERMQLSRVIRHYANERDVTARLGVLAGSVNRVKIDGEQEVYARAGHLGHAH